MYRDDTSIQPVEPHIAPADLLHDSFESWRIGKGRQRIGQVVVLFKSFSNDRTE